MVSKASSPCQLVTLLPIKALLPVKSLVTYNVPPSLLCKGKKSFPCGNGFGMGGCENLLTEGAFLKLILKISDI